MVANASAVQNWLRSTRRISVPDDWLQACIEWIHSENEVDRSNSERLCEHVYEQWLFSDLREIGASCLPPGLSQHLKHVLNGSFAMQVNSIADVGSSFYTQLQKSRGTENGNASVSATQPSQPAWEPKPSRMLMMKMTDGSQEVQAMEYQPIPALNQGLPPGTKVLVAGKVLCRNGVLMLKSENVRILGGEVDNLMQENTVDRVLSNSLEYNINLGSGPRELPRKVYAVENHQSRPNVTTVASVVNSNRQPLCPQMTVVPTYNRKRLSDDIPDEDLVTVGTSVDELDPCQWDEEDFADSVQAEMSREDSGFISRTSTASSVTQHANSADALNLHKKQKTEPRDLANNSANIFGSSDVNFDDDEFDWETSLASACKTKRTRTEPGKNQLETPTASSKTLSSKLSEKVATSQLRRTDASTERGTRLEKSALTSGETGIRWSAGEDESLISHHLMESSADDVTSTCAQMQDDAYVEFSGEMSPSEQTSACLSVIPFTYLSQILNQEYSETRQTFNIKAYISTLVGRLENNQGTHWSLVVKVNDGSAAVDVLLDDKILADLIGFSASDCVHMKQLAKSDHLIRRRLTEGVMRCQEMLVRLSTLMEIEVSSSLAMPCVRSIRPVAAQDVEALANRLRQKIHRNR